MGRIAILTNLCDFSPSYSLVSIILDQATMFSRFGHEVHLYTNQKCLKEENSHFLHHNTLPNIDLTDYSKQSELSDYSKEKVQILANFLNKELTSYDIVITHDFLLTGWNLPYFLALELCPNLKCKFYHWLHSVPRGVYNGKWESKDWWDLNRLGPNHYLVSMTEVIKPLIMERYKTDRVVVVPHIKDIRTFADFSPETCDIIDQVPLILQGDIVCIYPASTDRLGAKRVPTCIALMSALKRRCQKVCLVVANQWAKGTVARIGGATQENIDKTITEHKEVCELLTPPLVWGQEVVFTSEINFPQYKLGVSKRILRELMMCSNLFLFPSVEESWGLVPHEAALMGNHIVLNGDVEVLHEAFMDFGQYENFGSFTHSVQIPVQAQPQYLDNIAGNIKQQMFSSSAIQTRTLIRQKYNMDSVYLDFYQKLLGGV